jgi:hypothetical protein
MRQGEQMCLCKKIAQNVAQYIFIQTYAQLLPLKTAA